MVVVVGFCLLGDSAGRQMQQNRQKMLRPNCSTVCLCTLFASTTTSFSPAGSVHCEECATAAHFLVAEEQCSCSSSLFSTLATLIESLASGCTCCAVLCVCLLKVSPQCVVDAAAAAAQFATGHLVDWPPMPDAIGHIDRICWCSPIHCHHYECF